VDSRQVAQVEGLWACEKESFEVAFEAI